MQHDYYSQNEAASYLGMSLYTLNHYRNAGDAPTAIKLGTGKTARLIYRRTALDRWVKARAAHTENRKTAKVRKTARKAVRAARQAGAAPQGV